MVLILTVDYINECLKINFVILKVTVIVRNCLLKHVEFEIKSQLFVIVGLISNEKLQMG